MSLWSGSQRLLVSVRALRSATRRHGRARGASPLGRGVPSEETEVYSSQHKYVSWHAALVAAVATKRGSGWPSRRVACTAATAGPLPPVLLLIIEASEQHSRPTCLLGAGARELAARQVPLGGRVPSRHASGGAHVVEVVEVLPSGAPAAEGRRSRLVPFPRT